MEQKKKKKNKGMKMPRRSTTLSFLIPGRDLNKTCATNCPYHGSHSPMKPTKLGYLSRAPPPPSNLEASRLDRFGLNNPARTLKRVADHVVIAGSGGCGVGSNPGGLKGVHAGAGVLSRPIARPGGCGGQGAMFETNIPSPLQGLSPLSTTNQR